MYSGFSSKPELIIAVVFKKYFFIIFSRSFMLDEYL